VQVERPEIRIQSPAHAALESINVAERRRRLGVMVAAEFIQEVVYLAHE
jgi:hypothetical protein